MHIPEAKSVSLHLLKQMATLLPLVEANTKESQRFDSGVSVGVQGRDMRRRIRIWTSLITQMECADISMLLWNRSSHT